jgi:hypothetical protein
VEQLIFIGVLVVFSILNEIAKKKKAEALAKQQGEGAGELTPEELDWMFDPVVEDVADAEGQGDNPGRAGATSAGSGAEGVIPRNVWEEIAALASGAPLPPPAPAEPPTPVKPVAPEPVRAERLPPERGPARPAHEVHQAHAKYGTPVSQRLRPLDTPEMHRVDARSREVRDTLALLEGGRESLRQAVILQEVLGPPVSLRDE